MIPIRFTRTQTLTKAHTEPLARQSPTYSQGAYILSRVATNIHYNSNTKVLSVMYVLALALAIVLVSMVWGNIGNILGDELNFTG